MTTEAVRIHDTAYDRRMDFDRPARSESLADEALAQGEIRVGEAVRDFRTWRSIHVGGTGGNRDETTLELLVLGTLLALHPATDKKQSAPAGDGGFMTGLFVTLFVRFAKHDNGSALAGLESLVELLARTGDFQVELKRFALWRKFLQESKRKYQIEYLKAIREFGLWFVERNAPADRHRIKQNLNLVAAVVLNRVWKEGFLQTPRKLLVLPGCLRLKNPEKCRARSTRFGLYCAGCAGACTVHTTAVMAAAQGVETVVIEHQSKVFGEQRAADIREAGYGVIGVACAMKLIAGGWKAQDSGIKAQCLPLSSAGCPRHRSDGRAGLSELDMAALEKVLEGSINIDN